MNDILSSMLEAASACRHAAAADRCWREGATELPAQRSRSAALNAISQLQTALPAEFYHAAPGGRLRAERLLSAALLIVSADGRELGSSSVELDIAAHLLGLAHDLTPIRLEENSRIYA